MHRVLATFLLLTTAAFAQSDVHGVHPANMDKTAIPGDAWYTYANGTYLARTEIPADRTGISGFSALADAVNKRVAAIVKDSATAAPGTDTHKIADLYASFMDQPAIEANGLKWARSHELDVVNHIQDRDSLIFFLGLSLRADTDALNNTNFHTANLFGVWVAPGFNDPDHYAPYLMQGGGLLPDRAFYLDDSAHMKSIREAYLKHAAKMFAIAGYDHPDDRAAHVLALETAIAKVQIPLADDEDIKKANNQWTVDELKTRAPGINWPVFLECAGLLSHGDAKGKTYYIWQPSAITGEAALVSSEPIDEWKDWLTLHLLEKYAIGLSSAIADERFAFFGTVLSGAKQQRPREQQAVALVNSMLPDAVGKLYSEQYFPAADKARVEEMVHNLLVAFHARLEAVTWMAPATKAEALKKLGTLQVGIGYPDHFRSYTGLQIKPDSLIENIYHSSVFEYQYNLSRIGKPTDRKEWCMPPQLVNAVNLPLDNGLNFPAAIFGPPFFDPKAPDAVNYGAIGTVIGHEISHTFDSEGAAFDSQGKVRNWWTDADRAHFDASIEALANQYDTYYPFPDLHLNGHQTLGENIADLAGITASHDAWLASLHGQPAPVVDGLTGEQQFFLGYAQSESGKSREAARRQQVVTDPHSPSEYRADTVRNLDAWYAAFNVKPGQKLYLPPDQRVHIW